MNPDNGPGYEAKHEPGGSRHTLWTNCMAPLISGGCDMYGYIGTNYFDIKSVSSGARYRGTVAGNWRVKVASTSSNTISFHEYTSGGGSETSGGAVGTARSMTFAAGAGPFGFKSWATNSSTGVTLPGGLALSTSYYLRPVGATPALTYTMHTSRAHAIAGTGVVDITDTGGGSGNGPFYLGFRRDSGTENGSTRAYQNITGEMTRMVTLHPTLSGWFFDECSDADSSGSGFDALMDSIIAYRDANHPTLKMIINGVGHSQARSEAYDISVVENDWRYVVTRGVLTLTGQPSDTNTFTLGAKTYTLQTTLTNTDGNIKIGATTADTCANIVAAITLGAGSGTVYAAATTAHPTCTARLGTGTTVLARTLLSTAGGTVACTETMSNATWKDYNTASTITTLQGGASNSLVPSWQRSGAVDTDRFWIMVQEDVTAADLGDVATFCKANNVGFLYMNGTSAFSALPTTGVDGFSQDNVLAAIDAVNV
jgi:hypothetical protein